MREVNEIIEDVKKASLDIATKQKDKSNAEAKYMDASRLLDEAQQVGADLKLELNTALGILVPDSIQGRVRTS